MSYHTKRAQHNFSRKVVKNTTPIIGLGEKTEDNAYGGPNIATKNDSSTTAMVMGDHQINLAHGGPSDNGELCFRDNVKHHRKGGHNTKNFVTTGTQTCVNNTKTTRTGNQQSPKNSEYCLAKHDPIEI